VPLLNGDWSDSRGGSQYDPERDGWAGSRMAPLRWVVWWSGDSCAISVKTDSGIGPGAAWL